MPSLFEHQIHQDIIYISNRRYSIHINENLNISLENVFTVRFCYNRWSSTCTTKL